MAGADDKRPDGCLCDCHRRDNAVDDNQAHVPERVLGSVFHDSSIWDSSPVKIKWQFMEEVEDEWKRD
jgi:hypothetical protein|tara:strand:+ start:137 stop:340 length:204 start_codon:yes stop_codon:yes gene_type:complete